MRATILLALLALAAAPAWAAEGGGIRVQITPDPGGASGLIQGSVEIEATPEVVLTVLIDCDAAPRLVARLKSCKVL